MHFSIIIPTCNRTADLAKCLDRLAPRAQTLSSDYYDVIVTDDGASDDSMKLLRTHYPWAHWFRGPRKGPAANRNNGAAHAKGDWLVFTDDDCLPDAGWLQAYASAVVCDESHSVFEGRTYADRPRPSLDSVSPINETGGYLWSCNFAIKRDVFNTLKGFDERFPFAAMEDVDFSLRLKGIGCKPEFLRDAAVCHPWRFMRGIRPLKQHEQSTLIYLKLHPDERRRINTNFYIRKHARLLIFDTLPGTFKCRGKGLMQAILMHGFGLRTAFRLLVRL